MPRILHLAAAALVLVFAAGSARADDDNYALAINGHQFVPIEIDIPAGKKVTLTVKNNNTVPSEFESSDLNREKVVVGGSDITVFIGPLRPGSYEFFDDFSPDTPHGHIVAK
jgi:hypothetical protein